MRFHGIYAPHIVEYLKLKRDLGFKLKDAEYVFSMFFTGPNSSMG